MYVNYLHRVDIGHQLLDISSIALAKITLVKSLFLQEQKCKDSITFPSPSTLTTLSIDSPISSAYMAT